MKYQGQFITVATPADESEKSSYATLYRVSPERATEIQEQIHRHFHANRLDKHTIDTKAFLESLPVDAANPGELALAGVFLGQHMANTERDQTPLAALVSALFR